MRWPKIDALLATVPVPSGYQVEQLASADIPGLIERLRSWYGDIQVGAESCHLREAFYKNEVQLADLPGERKVLACIVRQAGPMVGMFSFEYNEDARSLFGRLGVLAPEHRGRHIADTGLMLQESVARAVGAEVILHFATLKSPHSQRMHERLGFRAVGIVPAYDRDMVEPGKVRRVFEALYVKVLASPDTVLRPSPDNMTPSVRALYEHLFDGSEAMGGNNA